jgi:hypothetical protein
MFFILEGSVAGKAIEIPLDHVFAVLLHPFPTLFRDDFQAIQSADAIDQATVERNLGGSMFQVAEGGNGPFFTVSVYAVFDANENAEVGEGSDWQVEKFVVRHAQRIHQERTCRKLSFALSKEKITAHFRLSS